MHLSPLLNTRVLATQITLNFSQFLFFDRIHHKNEIICTFPLSIFLIIPQFHSNQYYPITSTGDKRRDVRWEPWIAWWCAPFCLFALFVFSMAVLAAWAQYGLDLSFVSLKWRLRFYSSFWVAAGDSSGRSLGRIVFGSSHCGFGWRETFFLSWLTLAYDEMALYTISNSLQSFRCSSLYNRYNLPNRYYYLSTMLYCYLDFTLYIISGLLHRLFTSLTHSSQKSYLAICILLIVALFQLLVLCSYVVNPLFIMEKGKQKSSYSDALYSEASQANESNNKTNDNSTQSNKTNQATGSPHSHLKLKPNLPFLGKPEENPL